MNCYIDITLLPSEDIGHYFLWEKVYNQVHLALVEHKNAAGGFSIAAAFPEYSTDKKRLGSKLRLLSQDEEVLIQLNITKWLARFADYVHITSIRSVPSGIGHYMAYGRPKVMNNKQRLIERRMKRHNQSLEQATEHFEGFKPQQSKAPFVHIKSHTKDMRFPLFIEELLCEAQSQQTVIFDSYGLSNKGGLPKF